MHPEPQQGSNISSPQGLCSLPVTPGAQIQSTALKQPQTGPCHPAPCWGNDGRGLPAMPENTLTTGSPLPPQGCKQSPSPEGSFWTRVSPALPAEALAELGSSALLQEHMQCSPQPAASPQPLHSGTHQGLAARDATPEKFGELLCPHQIALTFSIFHIFIGCPFPPNPHRLIRQRAAPQPMLLHDTEKVRDMEAERALSRGCLEQDSNTPQPTQAAHQDLLPRDPRRQSSCCRLPGDAPTHPCSQTHSCCCKGTWAPWHRASNETSCHKKAQGRAVLLQHRGSRKAAEMP